MVCAFTVVVFAHDLKRIGDVSQLQNEVIEVHGPVKEYDGRPKIVLQQLRQLGGEGLGIPRLPKNYDVENKGHYSAGSFSLPKPAYTTHKKKQTAKIPIDIPPDSDSIEIPALRNSPAPPATGARFLDPRPRRALKHLLPTKFATWDTTTEVKPAALPLFKGEVLCPRNHNH
jgi:hypothetical protein